MKKYLISLILSASIISSWSITLAQNSDIIVSEIMYDPGSGLEEWIELFNRGSAEVDIHGWTIEDRTASAQTITASTLVIPPGGYLVLSGSSSLSAFSSTLPFKVNGFLSLNNLGDTVILRDNASIIVDSVIYDGNIGGKGISMERVNPFGASNDPRNWATSTSPEGGTPDRVNSVHTDPPEHNLSVYSSDLALTPPNPIVGTTATIQALITNEGRNTETVEIGFYQGHPDKGGLIIFKETFSLSAGSESLRSSEWRLPQSDGVYNIYVKIEPVEAETDIDDNLAFISIPLGKVSYQMVINEIFYSPIDSGVEWIELYNAGDIEVDIRGWGFSDQSIIQNGDDPKVITKASRPLAPGGYLILTEERMKFLEDFSVFEEGGVVEVSAMPSLNDDGDSILVTDSAGNDVDRVNYIRSWGGGKGLSLERIDPNGKSDDRHNWESSANPRGGTPLEANSRFGLGRDLKGALLKIEPKIFSPHVGESTTILYDVPTQALVTLYVFDIKGRLVLRLLAEKEAGGKRGIIWDGKDSTGRIAPMGYYIVYLESSNRGRAQTSVAKRTVVVGRRLN